MKVSLKLILALITGMTVCCSSDHIINNTQYLKSTETAFNLRKQLASKRDSALFTVFTNNLSVSQTEALKFLYAFMPLNDLADRDGGFFLANVNMALRAKSETSWGKNIPEDIFLHYVLPCRVNNENLDSFRIVFFDELMSRIKGKDLSDAALEINHWCHEKVNYQPSDIRTSAPMSTILSARGRCGEESTLTVAALRTVGIPARQVYTPRWAHTDDNHAWVEIWNNGVWNYMGACEPEPVLDRGWFTEPARRAMLVHTKSFGASRGNENVINEFKNYTDVNTLEKYASTKKIVVKVTDADNNPVSNAQVEYQLYNYAEFYSLAIVPTNESGFSQFETGFGDLLIWAHKEDNFDFKKISVGATDTLLLKLNINTLGTNSIDLDLDVPVIPSPLPVPPQELAEKNTERINSENAIRQKYVDSWMKPEEAKKLATSLKLDTAEIIKIFRRSMGNHKMIASFLNETPASMLPVAVSLLEILPDKDLRDINGIVLKDHLKNCNIPEGTDSKFFMEYVLNPRIANELLVPWRAYFLSKLPAQVKQAAPNNPLTVAGYLNDNIIIADDENYYNTPLTPIGVNELKVSDNNSRAICFVAICRSLGIPSRLEPARNIPQYFLDKTWHDVWFSNQKQADLNKGFIKLQSSDTKPVPEYYIHFTLAHFENGRYNTLEYDFNKKITDFKEELPLPPGHYMLVTGNRLDNGRILSNISFFDLSENEHKTVEVKIRKEVDGKKILGKIDLERIYVLPGMNTLPQSCVKHNGVVIIWTEPESEPAKHIFNDLREMKPEFDAWGGNFIFMSGNKDFPVKQIPGLPVNISVGSDNQLAILKESVKFIAPTEKSLPFVMVTDSEGNIFFASAGYRVGIGDQILKFIR